MKIRKAIQASILVLALGLSQNTQASEYEVEQVNIPDIAHIVDMGITEAPPVKPLSAKEQVAQLVEEIELDDEFVANLKSTDKDLFCLAVNNYYEASGESLHGKIAISEVVVNRTNHPEYPNTPCGVIKQSTVRNGTKICQFSWVCDRSLNAPRVGKEGTASHDAWLHSIKAAIIVYKENFSGIVAGATHFYQHRTVKPIWSSSAKMRHVGKVGNHTFLALK